MEFFYGVFSIILKKAFKKLWEQNGADEIVENCKKRKPRSAAIERILAMSKKRKSEQITTDEGNSLKIHFCFNLQSFFPHN